MRKISMRKQLLQQLGSVGLKDFKTSNERELAHNLLQEMSKNESLNFNEQIQADFKEAKKDE